MKDAKSKQVKAYIKELKMYLPVFCADTKRYVSDMRQALGDFVQENENAGKEDLVREFGAPKDMAANYMIEADGEVLGKAILRSRYLKRVITIVALSIMVFYGIECTLAIISFHRLEEAYISREVIEIKVEDEYQVEDEGQIEEESQIKE